MRKRNLVVAIDGPAGAGKSTVAQLAAKKLEYTYIDTGAMYRAVAWRSLRAGAPLTDEKILRALEDIDVLLSYEDGKTRVFVNGEDVTKEIRTPEVSAVVSRVAAMGEVRAKLVELQRKMAVHGAVLMDGRDIATNVLPNADVKIFLTASIEERAARRWKELKEKGYDTSFEEVKSDIAKRDKADSEREISPLVQAEDAELLDTTGMTIEEVVAAILKRCE
ncbi:(d)CMP kinase [Selenomonas sp. TAMA-11512]|uniref:(d)CMP kinase n=1 Tax=Selenomonas sp. TAMA-11512 TaxID=3095337 RepID=UPI003086C0F5|nr:(d)CMP kinase [Selenomonas sp. TAMA-11512]